MVAMTIKVPGLCVLCEVRVHRKDSVCTVRCEVSDMAVRTVEDRANNTRKKELRCRSWFRHCTTSQKVKGSIPDGATGFFLWHNPSGRTVIEMSTRNISWG